MKPRTVFLIVLMTCATCVAAEWRELSSGTLESTRGGKCQCYKDFCIFSETYCTDATTSGACSNQNDERTKSGAVCDKCTKGTKESQSCTDGTTDVVCTEYKKCKWDNNACVTNSNSWSDSAAKKACGATGDKCD